MEQHIITNGLYAYDKSECRYICVLNKYDMEIIDANNTTRRTLKLEQKIDRGDHYHKTKNERFITTYHKNCIVVYTKPDFKATVIDQGIDFDYYDFILYAPNSGLLVAKKDHMLKLSINNNCVYIQPRDIISPNTDSDDLYFVEYKDSKPYLYKYITSENRFISTRIIYKGDSPHINAYNNTIEIGNTIYCRYSLKLLFTADAHATRLTKKILLAGNYCVIIYGNNFANVYNTITDTLINRFETKYPGNMKSEISGNLLITSHLYDQVSLYDLNKGYICDIKSYMYYISGPRDVILSENGSFLYVLGNSSLDIYNLEESLITVKKFGFLKGIKSPESSIGKFANNYLFDEHLINEIFSFVV
jgi:hypothetical protein